MVERLERESPRHGAVAYECNRLELLACQVARARHAGNRRDAGAGVPRGKAVVFAFVPIGESGQAAESAKRLKILAPAGDELVRIGLMADIEDYLVAGRIENVVDGEYELDRAQTGCKMPSTMRCCRYYLVPDLLGQLAKLTYRERFEILGAVYLVEKIFHKTIILVFLCLSAADEVGDCFEYARTRREIL